MKYPFLDFLGPSLIPELGADIAAGTPCHIHGILIPVSAAGAFPYKLSFIITYNLDFPVKTALLAVIAFGIQLCIQNIVINMLHNGKDRLNIILHIGHFHIADGAAGGEGLELGLEGQLGESVDLLGDVDVVGVGDIALVGDILNDAEPLLQALGEAVGGRLQRGAVEGEVDVALRLPLGAGVVHMLHDLQAEGGALLGVGVALAGHVLDALVESGVAQGDGGVTVEEQLVDGFPLLQTSQGAVLPENGGGVGQGAL